MRLRWLLLMVSVVCLMVLAPASALSQGTRVTDHSQSFSSHSKAELATTILLLVSSRHIPLLEDSFCFLGGQVDLPPVPPSGIMMKDPDFAKLSCSARESGTDRRLAKATAIELGTEWKRERKRSR